MRDQIVAALDATCQGFSPDRVVADPDLNSAFVAQCDRLGLREPASILNRWLLNLRKRGLLGDRRSKKTSFANENDFRFAAEMSVRFLERRDEVSLDEIICDPKRAAEFDELAARIAPGYSPIQYRWAALNLRKSSRLKPELLVRVVHPENLKCFRVDQIEMSEIPREQGLYLFYTHSVALYAGETDSLRIRIETHLDHSNNKGLARWLWDHDHTAQKLHLEIQVLPSKTPTRVRRALELELIRSRSPLFNIKR